MRIREVSLVDDRHLAVGTVHVDGRKFLHIRIVEKFGTRCGRRILAVSREVRTNQVQHLLIVGSRLVERNIQRSGTCTVEHHVVDHGIVVDIGSKDTGAGTDDVPMLVVDIPRELQTRLNLKSRQAVVCSQSQFVVYRLVKFTLVEISSIVQTQAGSQFKSREELGLQLRISSCVQDILFHTVVGSKIQFTNVAVRFQIVESIQTVEVETSVRFTAVA
ncbi:unknown [Bacteroides sp. CAG:1076]|nr:unknown [Bacteroides sp. CAG:1076]